uniref:DENN domain-containing protein 3-like n=1 Tax=Petromyzon marinus TaxID=7757 RepID=A0AAJ7T0T8_PETMA|nr:DENN domain-containing protein 3-like [Petromyzon marinus]
MAERLPCALLEACVVLGASGRHLHEHTGQDHQDELTPLILDVLTPPCPGELRDGAAPTATSSSSTPSSSSTSSSSGEEVPGRQGSVELGWSSTLDHADGSWELELDGLPQLCFPDGLRVLAGPLPDRFHSLALTDMRGQRAYGVVLTHYRAVRQPQHEEIRTRMVNGESGGPKTPGESGGLKEAGESGGLKEVGESGGLKEAGESGGLKEAGESGGLKEAGESGGLKEAGESGGLKEVGESGGLKEVGESGGLKEAGESGGLKEVGESGGLKEVGESGGLKEAGESGGLKEVGESGGLKEVGESGGLKEAGESGGLKEAGESGGLKEAGESGGLKEVGESGGLKEAGESGGLKEAGESGGLKEAGESGGLKEAGERGGLKEVGESGGLKEAGESGGLKEAGESGGLKEAGESGGLKEAGESGGLKEAGETGGSAVPLYSPICVCLISRAPYFTALQEFLSWLSHTLASRRCATTTTAVSVTEAAVVVEVSRFAARLFLVPLAPPGPLHLCVEMGPLRVLLPPSDSEVHDLDLTLPFTCLRSRHLLQVLTCLLLEQKLVLLSAEWALLAPAGHCLLAFLAPLCWRHTFVPVLASSMLGFLEAPTVYLMGTHGRHKHAVSQVEDLVIVDLDSGQLIPTPASVPGYPPGSAGPPGTPNGQSLTPLIAPPEEAAEAFLSRCRHFCVREEAHALGVATPCSLHELRRAARARRQRLNTCIQELFLGFIHHAFREVLAHLDVEQRVFSREEFLESRRPADLPFYRKVLDTDVFDLFLKDRLAQKADSFSRLENKSSSWSQKMKQEMLRSLRRRTTEDRARQQPRPTSAHLGAHLGALPGDGVTTTQAGEEHDPSGLAFAGGPFVRGQGAGGRGPMEPWGPDPWDDGTVFTLPPLPPDPLLPGEGQRYCEGLGAALGAALGEVAPSRWGLRAALHAVRAGARLASRQPELALHDLHSISKMDKSVVPPDEARRILLLLPTWARAQVEERPELRWLLQEEVDEPALLSPHAAGPCPGSPDGRVRSFALPSAPLSCDELGTCVREAGITCDPATVGRLFGALTNGRGEVLPADAVRRLYEAWRATERAARELSLPVEALARLESSEIVYKVSPVVLTSLGQGRVAMTQSRLFLLRDGAAVPFVDIAKFSDIEDVQEVSTLGVLRPRLHALRVVSRRHPGAPFVANLKEQHGPWCLAVREMRAGKRLAHALKDAQFVHRALTNVLLMDAVAQCVRRKRAATAAAMLAHCTREDARVSVESGPLATLAALDTLDTLVHRVTPAQGKPLAVDALLYVPGELLHGGGGGEGTPPRLWCALSGGRVVVFDAATWTVEHGHLQAGTKRLNRLLCVGGSQVWAASSDRSVYILEGHVGGALGCRRHLAGHADEVTDLLHDDDDDDRRPAGDGQHTGVISCSADGHMIVWDVQALEAVRHVRLPDCRSLTSVQLHGGELCGVDEE